MRLSELVTESDEPVMFEDFVRENCRPYMAALDADMEVIDSPRFSLYRGIKEASLTNDMEMVRHDRVVTAYVNRVRTDRQPKDTPADISSIVDDLLEKKFGWRPRAESAFCYTFKNRGAVEHYGDKYRVYPMGDLEFVYSPKVRDMTYQLAEWLRERKLWPSSGKIPPEALGETTEAIKEFVEEHGYTNKNLHAAMMSEGKPEIMVNCHKYLAVPAFRD